MLDATDKEGMAPRMAFQVIHVALADVGQIAQSHHCRSDRDIERQQATQRGGIAGIGEADVTVIVAK